MGKSITQKILEKHIIHGKFESGKEVAIRIDQTLTQDATGTMAYLQFEAMGMSKVKTELSVSYIDHNTIQVGFENADDHRYLQSIAAKYGILLSRAGNGICHQVHLERFGKPGKTLLGYDSHTPTGQNSRSISPNKPLRLVANHQLGQEHRAAFHMGEARLFKDGGQIFLDVTAIIRLVEVDRERLQHAVITFRVAQLQTVHEDQPSAGLQHPRPLLRDDAADLGRHLVEQVDRGQHIHRIVLKRQRFGIRHLELHP